MGDSNHSLAQENMEERIFNKIAQRLADGVRLAQADLEKKYGIERMKALGATPFKGTVDSVEVEAWLTLIEKCFWVMHCLEDRKVELATFLLKKRAED